VRQPALACQRVERCHVNLEYLAQAIEMAVELRRELREDGARLIGRPRFGARDHGRNRCDAGVQLDRVRQHVVSRFQPHLDQLGLHRVQRLVDFTRARRDLLATVY
jgi:hypothetical protein